MPINLREIASRHRFAFHSVRVGRLQIGPVSAKAFADVEEVLADESVTGSAFVRDLIPIVARHVPESSDGADIEEKGAAVTAEEASQIEEGELDTFAREFLKHNEYVFEVYEIADGKPELKRTEVVRLDGESDSDYLLRAMRRYVSYQKERLDSFARQITGMTKGFDPLKGLREAIRENFSISDKLRDLTNIGSKFRDLADVARLPGIAKVELPAMPEIEFEENPAYETNRRLNTVLDRFDDILLLANEAAALINSLNKASLEMLGAYAMNARRTEKYALAAIVIAVSSLVVTAGSSYLAYKQSKDGADASQKLAQQFTVDIRHVADTHAKTSDEMARHFEAEMQTLSESQFGRAEELLTRLQEALAAQSAEDRYALREVLKEALSPPSSGLDATTEVEPTPPKQE